MGPILDVMDWLQSGFGNTVRVYRNDKAISVAVC